MSAARLTGTAGMRNDSAVSRAREIAGDRSEMKARTPLDRYGERREVGPGGVCSPSHCSW